MAESGEFLSTDLWKPPPTGMVKLNVDGSFRDFDNSMGWGDLIRDEFSNWVIGFFNHSIGGNPFMAEANGLKDDGLQLVWNQGYKDVICEVDCAELVEDLDNVESLVVVPILAEIKKLLRRCWKVEIRYINRQANAAADCLAWKGAAEKVLGEQVLLLPFPDLQSLIMRDTL